MNKHDKDNMNTRHITRRMHSVRNGENWKMHKIDWCEGSLKLAYIATKYVGDHYLTPRMKYIIVGLDSWYKTLVQEG